MITLTVLSFNGGATERLSATFDELGGTIGRADTNQLVLPDPERTISRVHAQVAFRNGGFALIDRGSNPVLLNGRPLGNGHEAPLASGDQVQVGGYLMSVEINATRSASGAGGAGATPADPFADLAGFGGVADLGLGSPLGAMPIATPAAPAPAPLGGTPAGRGTAPAASSGGIPDDWDPFAPDPQNNLGRNPGGGIPDDFRLGLGASASPLGPGIAPTRAEESLDNLFGLGPTSNSGVDPLGGSVFQDPLAGPNTAGSSDPLRAFGMAAQGGANAVADHASELNTPFIAARVSTPAAASVATPQATQQSTSPSVAQGAVLSWGDHGGGESRTIIRATGKAPTAAPAAVPPAPAAPAVAPARTNAALAGSADVQALLAALREGLGVPSLQIDTLTPELMKLIGQLLRESTQGTVELLVARAALKREIRAEVTMIVARENNPLKFSPSVEVALSHLLSPPARGFMPAAPAMRDAYDDLRAHQFGFVAGMRAALDGVLKRFNPEQLEGKLTQKSVLNALLPATRKARLWELFQELYGQISEEAAEDFHELFGKEFLRAYEAHIEQLKSGKR